MDGERGMARIIEEERKIYFAFLDKVGTSKTDKTLLSFTEVGLVGLFAKHMIIVPWQSQKKFGIVLICSVL